MGDDSEQPHKTMIKQLTDLDDHALDEQAGLFMHPRRKSLRTDTTPRPLSQPFFQPSHVFPDVLSVSAMVERQEKGHREQRDEGAVAENKSSGTISSLNAQDAGLVASTAQYPPSLALQAARVGAENAEAAAAAAAAAAAGQEGPAGSAAGKARAGLRSVSLTRIAGERSEASGVRSGGSGNVSGRDGGELPQTVPTPTPVLRAGTPIETPHEEGDRQLSVETSKAGRAGVRRSGGRRAANERAAGRGGRLFARRANASSRGSEEDLSGDDEQFIYRNSRSSLHVSSIPEDAGELDAPGRRRTTRPRLSTYLGSAERRESAGVGVGGAMAAGSFGHAYSSSATAQGGSGSSGARAARRAGRAGRGNGASMAGGHRFSILAHGDYGAATSEESDVDGDPAGLRSAYAPRRNSRRLQPTYYASSEDMPEAAPLFRRHHGAQRKRRGAVAQALRTLMFGVLVLAALFVAVVLFNCTSAPLTDVAAVRVANILATEKELLFILHVQATNPNVREVLVERAEIGVFAAAATNTTGVGVRANDTEPAILLGNVYELADPMRFAPGSLRTPATDLKTTQISIHHPGAALGDDGDEDSDAARWRRLLKGPYDLTVRGTLQYSLWQRNYAARICIAKLANLPPDNATASDTFSTAPRLIAAGLGCDEGDDDDTITLPAPPAPPFARALHRLLRRG
ncbi:Vacuolar inheritance and morphology protein [Coemansia sp. Benny D115]|nr:Vacuolar inheritance and morphology protein [Coemansia sp. Benny D115]